MKKVILITLLGLFGLNCLADTWQGLCELKKLVGTHKNDWMQFTKDDHAAKFDLLIRQQTDWVNLGVDNCNDLRKLNLQNSENIARQELSKAFKLYSIDHKAQWIDYAKKSQNKMIDLKKKHDQQLKDFANKYLTFEKQNLVAK